MQVLLVTSLYPGYENQPRSEVTYALHYFAREWVRQGHTVRVAAIWRYYPGVLKYFRGMEKRAKYAYPEEFELEGVRILRCPIKKFPRLNYPDRRVAKAAQGIIDWLDRQNFVPDVVICHMLNPPLLIGHKVAQRYTRPLIMGVHGTDVLELAKPRVRKRYLRVKDDIAMLAFRSRAIEAKYSSIMGRPEGEHFLLYSGIEREVLLPPEKLLPKSRRPIEEILVVGQLVKRKNIDIVLRAFARLVERSGRQELALKVVGTGPMGQDLRDLAASLGISQQVVFCNQLPREEVLQLMEAADIFVLVSSTETFGLVYIEAMAKGCITIGTKGEGIDGVLVDGENGFLCHPQPEELACLLEKALTLSAEERYGLMAKAWETAEGMNQNKLAEGYLARIAKACGSQ